MRPKVTSRVAVTTMYPMSSHRKYPVCPGANGLMPIPLKIAGSEINTMLASMLAIRDPSVVLISATHL
jgi:hypothetical protein